MLDDDNPRLQYHLPCPDCGSPAGLEVRERNTYCHGCHVSKQTSGAKWLEEHGSDTVEDTATIAAVEFNGELSHGRTHRIKDRGLLRDTVAKYGTTVLTGLGASDKAHITGHVYPYFHKEDVTRHIGNQIRILPKNIYAEGDMSGHHYALFGQQAFPAGCAKALTICEGAIDCMSVYQMQGNQYPVVSVVSSSSAEKDVKANLAYVESFGEVRICMDPDKPGREAAEKIAALLSPGKAYIVCLDENVDANDYLMANRKTEFVKTWWRAELWSPAGLVTTTQLKARLKDYVRPVGLDYPWEGLTRLTHGIRRGEWVLLLGWPKAGKTTVVRELKLQVLEQDPDAIVGWFGFEETPEESGEALGALSCDVPFDVPETEYEQSVKDGAMARVLDGDLNRVVYYESAGLRSVDEIIQAMRFMIKGQGVTHIVFDHMSFVVANQSGDDRKFLDTLSMDIRSLIMETGVAFISAIHLNAKGKSRGSMAPLQLANVVIRLFRDKESNSEADRNVLHLRVMEARKPAREGPACSLQWNAITGRLHEMTRVNVKAIDELMEKETRL